MKPKGSDSLEPEMSSRPPISLAWPQLIAVRKKWITTHLRDYLSCLNNTSHYATQTRHSGIAHSQLPRFERLGYTWSESFTNHGLFRIPKFVVQKKFGLYCNSRWEVALRGMGTTLNPVFFYKPTYCKYDRSVATHGSLWPRTWYKESLMARGHGSHLRHLSVLYFEFLSHK